MAVRRARSHAGVSGAARAFRYNPVDVLRRILDIAGFAVDAILSVDLQPHIAVFHGNVLVDAFEEIITDIQLIGTRPWKRKAVIIN